MVDEAVRQLEAGRRHPLERLVQGWRRVAHVVLLAAGYGRVSLSAPVAPVTKTRMIFPPAWRFTVEDVAPPETVTPATLPAELRRLGSRPAGLPQLGTKNDLHAASHAGEPTRTPPRVGDPGS